MCIPVWDSHQPPVLCRGPNLDEGRGAEGVCEGSGPGKAAHFPQEEQVRQQRGHGHRPPACATRHVIIG